MPNPPKTELNLLAAVIACHGGKVNCASMAAVLDVTYHTVENRMRLVKRQAQDMLSEAIAAERIDANGKPLGQAGGKRKFEAVKAEPDTPVKSKRAKTSKSGAVSKASKAGKAGRGKMDKESSLSDEEQVDGAEESDQVIVNAEKAASVEADASDE